LSILVIVATKTFSYSQIYNTIEKVNNYWNRFKPDSCVEEGFQQKWLGEIQFLNHLSDQTGVTIFLWDVLHSRFIYAVDPKKLLGDLIEIVSETGIDFTTSNIHPDYLHGGLLLNQKAIEYSIKHFPISNKMSLSFDYLYRNNEGVYFQLLQQSVPVERNKEGYPLLFLSYVHDISHLKKTETANLIITTPEETQIWNYSFDKNCLERTTDLSSQEKKILQLLGQGKHTKQISEIEHCSPHTIDTHRRNILKKINCVDTTAAISYARMVGLM
jgi:DNA-binding CsgD family transcriptional regulator